MKNISDYVVGFIIAILVIFVLGSLLSSQLASQSLFDLIVNNAINISLALIISFYAVQIYESQRQELSFVIELMKKSEQVCEKMIDMVHRIVSETNDEATITVNAYVYYSESLLEYISSIDRLTKGNPKYKGITTELDEMRRLLFIHNITIFRLREKHGNMVDCMQFKLVSYILELQTHIPKLLGEIKY